MSIWSNSAEKQINSTCSFDSSFVLDTFGLEIRGIAIQDVNVGRMDVDMREEVLVHEGVVAFRMLAGNTNVFILRDSNISAIERSLKEE